MINDSALAEPTDCETPNRPYLLAYNPTLLKAVIFRPRCKMWSCRYCAKVNAGLWAIKAFNGAEVFEHNGQRVSFLTLTSHEKLDPESSLAVFPKSWAMLSTRARRAAESFDYLLIPEKHEDGRVHVHAIETADLGKRWWKDNARQSGMGYMADESEVRTPAGASWYVVKYIGKALKTTDWPKGFRRVRTSRSWPKLPVQTVLIDWSWLVIKHPDSLDETRGRYEGAGYEVALLGGNEAWRYVRGELLTD